MPDLEKQFAESRKQPAFGWAEFNPLNADRVKQFVDNVIDAHVDAGIVSTSDFEGDTLTLKDYNTSDGRPYAYFSIRQFEASDIKKKEDEKPEISLISPRATLTGLVRAKGRRRPEIMGISSYLVEPVLI